MKAVSVASSRRTSNVPEIQSGLGDIVIVD